MTPLVELPPQVVEEIVHRAGRPDFDRWSEQLQRCGYCSRPVRLRGRVVHRVGEWSPVGVLDGRRAGSGADDPVRQPASGSLPVVLL